MSINLTFILQLLNIWFAIFLLKTFFLRPLMSLVNFEKQALNDRIVLQKNELMKLNTEIVDVEKLLEKNQQLLQEKYLKIKDFLNFKPIFRSDLRNNFSRETLDEKNQFDTEILRQRVAKKLERLL